MLKTLRSVLRFRPVHLRAADRRLSTVASVADYRRLARRRLLHHLSAFLQSGGRKIDAWYATLKVVEVAFDDEATAFSNINTAEELRSAETGQRLPGE